MTAFNMKYWANLILIVPFLVAPGVFGATLTFSTSAPTATANAISNFTGATFDADNVGGSGVNANGGANNGSANDATTYVSTSRPAQGQTFTTGTNPGGYTISSITVQAVGYSNNIASGANDTYYSLANTSSTFVVRVGQLNGTTIIPYDVEYAASGGSGNPGTGISADGSGLFLTFTLKAPFVLQPNTVYAFDIGTTGDYFEMLGISSAAIAATGTTAYTSGSAYISGINGALAATITPEAGERVFQVNLTAYTPPAPVAGAFLHPGLLNTAADFQRMRTNVALGIQPWLSGYQAMTSSWMGAQNGGWNPNPQSTITRSGGSNNTSLLYNDIAVAYCYALKWEITGDTRYADQAVRILNAWGYTLTTLAGDTNIALIELYGYQFACVAEIMRTYPGWAPADIAQFQTMIYNVFYPLANSFLTGHFGTAYDHYWANWDLASINTMYAVGVFCDNPALTTQAVNYFYNGVGNGCIDRTANFIHPGLLGQGQEIGRDQGHASLDIAELAPLCQMAWNQGVDLFSYENNRVLSVAEYTAKYNLFYDVPFVPYYCSTGGLMSAPSGDIRGAISRPGWAILYNHYVNLKGLAAPYTQTVVNQDGTGYETGGYTYNGDEPEWDYLTSALPPIAAGANPSGLAAIVTAQQPVLSWWGSAYATSYNVLRSTTSGGPYTTIVSGLTTNTYTDTSVAPGTTYYYVVNGTLAGGTTGNSNEANAIVGVSLYAQLKFDETSGTTASDATGDGWTGTLMNGGTWTTGTINGAVNLSKASSQYVSLPSGVVANLSDFSISAWVYQNSATDWARVFDFGTGDGMWGGTDVWGNQIWLCERYMYLAAEDGGGKLRFGISRSTSGGVEEVATNSTLPIGQWVHVCVTKSGSVATLYLNGIAVGQNRNMPMTPMQITPTPDNYIGRSQWRNDPYFDGKIDDFRIYRGPLTTGSAYTLATGLAPATPPPAPANFTVTAQAGNQNLLTWTASAGATTYTISRSTTPGGPYVVIASLVSGTSYTDTGLTTGVTYYYVIDGANTGGDGAVSTQSSVTALPPIPSAPTGVNAFSSSSTAITINWVAAANDYSYTVKRSLTSGGPYTTLASGLTALTYTDTGLTTGTTYYYVVSSVNPAGEGANSAEDGAMPSDLLVHLRFDEGVGTTSADASGNGWNATLLNAPTWVPGIFGNAINFASASSQYATLATGVVSGLNDCTISVWVKMTSLATWARIYDLGTGTTNNMFLTAQGPAAGKPRFGIQTPSVAEQDIDSSIAIPTGTWTQIVVTLSGGTGRMYISGTLAGTNSAMTLTGSSLGNTTLNYLGHSQFSTDPYLNGSIDDLRLYGHAFTATDVTASANPSPTAPTGPAAIPSDSRVSLNWAVDETASTYNVKRATVSGGPYTTVASGLTTPAFVDTGLTDDTTYYYVVSAVNWLGESANSTETAGTPYAIAWASGDIGSVAATGSSSLSGQTATLIGSGADISGTADAFQFCQVALTGNCMITARVTSVQNVNPWSKAGVMIRGSLAANSMNAAMVVTPTTTNGVSWQWRLADGATTNNIGAQGITAPYWVRLVRTGTTIQGYRSSDGVNWASGGSATFSLLGSTAYVGLAVTSHLDGTTCTATFDNVTVNWLPTAPANLTATPGSQQIALTWSAVPNAATYNVKGSLTSGGPYITLATGLISQVYTDSGLSIGTPYYYVVSASNIIGESANSAEASAITSAPIGGPETLAPALAMSGTGANTNFAFTIRSSVPGHTYQLQYSNNLVSNSWTNIGSPQLGTGTDLTLNITVNPSSAPRGFYRVLIQQ